MLFSSLTFLLYFLPAVLLLHNVLPGRAQNAFLLLASLVFYAWGELKYLPLLLALLLASYLLARLIEDASRPKRRALLFLGALMNLGALCYYKYAGMLFALLGLGQYAPAVSLPLGISFFTFQTLAYLVDVYRGEIRAEKNPIDFCAFILLFPQLIAGPIIRYDELSGQLHEKRRPNAKALESGMAVFIFGLSLKVLLANPLGALWKELSAPGGDMGCAWLAMTGYGLQIYFDFFGYSLMAVGIGRMLGLAIPKNFDEPYAARSITMFWRRWHMTLSGWFRDYVYIPLGGNRKGKARTALNLLIVWAATGLWHGASLNFLLWGLYYFALLMLEKTAFSGFLSAHRVCAHIYTLLAVFFGWMLFALDDMSALPGFFQSLFSFSFGGRALFFLREYLVVLILSAVLLVPRATGRVRAFLSARPGLLAACMFVLLALNVCALVNSSYNPFLYFRF